MRSFKLLGGLRFGSRNYTLLCLVAASVMLIGLVSQLILEARPTRGFVGGFVLFLAFAVASLIHGRHSGQSTRGASDS